MMGKKVKKIPAKSERRTREGGAEKERNTHNTPKRRKKTQERGAVLVLPSSANYC